MANKGNQRGSLGHRLRYEFDKSMAAGPIALIGWLAIISLIVIAVAAGLIALLHIAPEGSDAMGFGEAAWEALMRTLDSGTMGGDAGWSFRVVMLMVTLGGIFIVSALIGVLSTASRASSMSSARAAPTSSRKTTRSSSTGRPRSSTSSPS